MPNEYQEDNKEVADTQVIEKIHPVKRTASIDFDEDDSPIQTSKRTKNLRWILDDDSEKDIHVHITERKNRRKMVLNDKDIEENIEISDKSRKARVSFNLDANKENILNTSDRDIEEAKKSRLSSDEYINIKKLKDTMKKLKREITKLASSIDGTVVNPDVESNLAKVKEKSDLERKRYTTLTSIPEELRDELHQIKEQARSKQTYTKQERSQRALYANKEYGILQNKQDAVKRNKLFGKAQSKTH